MALLGRTNCVTLSRFVDFGAYIDGGDLGEVLLPKKYLPQGAEVGDELEVFVYRDSKDRLVATTESPAAQVGECAYLEVVQVNKVGAFLAWGLEKDLFVPFGEQRWEMEQGRSYVVVLYIDNTDRIAGTTKLRKFLPMTSKTARRGDEVELLISNRTDLGYEAVIDNSCIGMVFENDALSRLSAGTRTTGYIKGIRPDGKIDLSLQPLESRGDLASRVLEDLRASGGSSSLTDKSSPEDIFAAYGVSKKAYKRALGALYKERLVSITRESVSLVSPESGG